MSEQMNMTGRSTNRRRLLATVSSLVLLGAMHGAAAGGGADGPPVWIEFNWQYDRLGGLGDPFLPPFSGTIMQAGFQSPQSVQNLKLYTYGGGGSLSFQPEESDWIFSAAVRYGRAHGRKSSHEETAGGPVHVHLGTISSTVTPAIVRVAEMRASNSEAHAIIDFQVGKDIGLGLFGSSSKSSFKFGVRFVQFKSQLIASVNGDPDFFFPTDLKYDAQYHHTYSAAARQERSFHGLGPSVSLQGSNALTGSPEDGELTFDWGVNAALLFGRQSVKGHHQTTGAFYYAKLFDKYTAQYHHVADPNRQRSVTVPNLGGFAGLSVRYSDVKFSLGYRADLFFGAIDGGIDTRHSTTRSFNGPFASMSIGMGD